MALDDFISFIFLPLYSLKQVTTPALMGGKLVKNALLLRKLSKKETHFNAWSFDFA